MHKLHQTLHVMELYDSYNHMIHIYAKLLRHIIISFAGIYEYVFYACLRLRLILLANDIETNPGPLFSSIVQGSFNQACVKYGEVAGSQCAAAIALFALCFSQNFSPFSWTTSVIDIVLDKGTELYCSLQTPRFLEVTDLPSLVYANSTVYHTTFSYSHQSWLMHESVDTFNTLLSHGLSQSKNVLLWVGHITLALMKTNDAVFLFDSHSRDKQGRIADTGLSSLLQFPSIENVGHYVSSVYLSHNTRIPYEFQIVTISTLQPLPPQENNDSNYLSTPSFHNLCLVPSAASSKMRPSKRASKEKTKFTNKRTCIYIPTASHCVDILSCPISADNAKSLLILSANCTSLFIPVSKWTNKTINLIIEHFFPLLSLETRIDQQSGVMYYAEIAINFTCQSQRFTYQTFLSDIANQ